MHIKYVESFYRGQPPQWGYPIARCPQCRHHHPVKEIAMPLPNDLKDLGVYHGYEKYVMELEPVLGAMSKRGMPVTPESWAALQAELLGDYATAEKAMQALIPPEVQDFSPKKGYKKPPLADIEAHPELYARRWFPLADLNTREERWVKLLPWKPSHNGLVRYMKYRKHPIPTDYKTGKVTTEEKEIKRLHERTKDFLYGAVLTYRNIGTVLNNHIKNWEPKGDGRVHPTFYYDTGTGQLAARRPNTMNAPTHGEDLKGELASKFRSMVVAKEGHTLVSFDYKSFHAQTLAFEAGDAAYLRLAKLDIHSYLTAHLVGHPDRDRMLGWGDADLAACLREIKKAHRVIRDTKAKRAILGYGFGMGYKKLFNMYRESFSGQSDAKRVFDTLNALFPRAAAWREEVRRLAHEQGYLLSRFGCVRWFWEVFKWEGGEWKPGGEDSEAAIAFLPANDAFCHIKESMLRLDGRGLLSRYGLVNQIHDALMFECPDNLLDECIVKVREEMERPSLVLVDDRTAPGGLSVRVGVSTGKVWNQMVEGV